MADNAPLPLATGSTRNAATDQVTYSGDLADVQLVRLVDVTGAEGSKAVGSLTLPVSAVSLPLPAGAATEATLSALNTKVTAVNTNAVVLAAGSAIAGKFGIDQTTPGTTTQPACTRLLA